MDIFCTWSLLQYVFAIHTFCVNRVTIGITECINGNMKINDMECDRKLKAECHFRSTVHNSLSFTYYKNKDSS